MQGKEENISEKNKECNFVGFQDKLNQISNEDYIKLIEKISSGTDLFLRIELARYLSNQINKDTEEILLKLLHDKSYLVQVEAIDSLFGFDSSRVKKEIWNKLASPHPLVRGYAYRFLCYSYDYRYNVVEKKLGNINERNTWAKIMLYIGLLQRGDSGKLRKLLLMYSKCNYLNRCAILNGLCDIYDTCSDNEKEIIEEFLKQNKIKRREKAVEEVFLNLWETVFEENKTK